MSASYALPMPGEAFDGGIVIASVWLNDDAECVTALLIVLQPEAPFYVVTEIDHPGNGEHPAPSGAWDVTVRTSFPNIVPAVREYEAEGATTDV